MKARSGIDELPQPFAQPEKGMLEIQFDKVVISIALISALRRLRGSEQIDGRAIVRCVQLSGGAESCMV